MLKYEEEKEVIKSTSTDNSVEKGKILSLEVQINALKEENRKLIERVDSMEKNIFRQVETYNQHIANLHVRMI